MKKRIYIVHGWSGYPEEAWFPWLKKELEAKGFNVIIPQLPDTENPRIYNWVPKLNEVVTKPDANTYFVGHSMGCQTIARYLESLPNEIHVGGAVFVAGFFKHLTGLGDKENVKTICEHWLNTPIDFAKIKSRLTKSIAIFSDNDPYVPLDNQEDFREMLKSEIIIKKSMGHFSGKRDGATILPIALQSILKISK